MSVKNKDGVLPLMRIEQDTKDALIREAGRQDRKLSNFVAMHLRNLAETIKEEEAKRGNVNA